MAQVVARQRPDSDMKADRAQLFGVNLFAACTVARISLDKIVTRLVPFVLVVLACLLVITYVPVISIGLRDLVYAK
jgi:C4-dicarboxylate transporter DctM subunit